MTTELSDKDLAPTAALDAALVPLRAYEDVHAKDAGCLGNVVTMLEALAKAARP